MYPLSELTKDEVSVDMECCLSGVNCHETHLKPQKRSCYEFLYSVCESDPLAPGCASLECCKHPEKCMPYNLYPNCKLVSDLYQKHHHIKNRKMPIIVTLSVISVLIIIVLIGINLGK